MKLLVIGLTVAALLIIVSLTPVLIGPTIAVRFAHWLGGAKVALVWGLFTGNGI